MNLHEDPFLLDAAKLIISGLDTRTDREGLEDTPKRFLKFWNEFLNPPDFEFTTFNKESYDQMVVVHNVPFFSVCEHHLAPFFGVAHMAYLPNDEGRICGLSKLPRTLEMFSRRLQNQERITQQVADFMQNKLQARGCGVRIKARHLCMEMRGVKKHDCFTTTTALTGAFKTEPGVKEEFFNSIK